MFGLSTAKLAIYGIVGAVVITAATSLFIYIQSLRSDLFEAQTAVGALTTATVVQKETIKSLEDTNKKWAERYDAFQKTLLQMQEKQEESNQHARKLNDVLSRHDLTALSLAKPGLIENRINRGSTNVLRLFESESGRSANNPSGDKSTPR